MGSPMARIARMVFVSPMVIPEQTAPLNSRTKVDRILESLIFQSLIPAENAPPLQNAKHLVQKA